MKKTFSVRFPLFVIFCIGAVAPVHAQLAIPSGGTGATSGSAAIGNLGLPVISVINFGATGNGTTDDTAAINLAMNACTGRAFPKNGCILYFPSGIYMTSGLTLQPFVQMKGDGWGTSVIQMKPGTSGDVVTIPVGTFNFSLKALTLDGNSSNGGTGNCFSTATTGLSPTEWNTANKQTASTNAQKWGRVDQVMFTNCSNDGIHINEFN